MLELNEKKMLLWCHESTFVPVYRKLLKEFAGSKCQFVRLIVHRPGKAGRVYVFDRSLDVDGDGRLIRDDLVNAKFKGNDGNKDSEIFKRFEKVADKVVFL